MDNNETTQVSSEGSNLKLDKQVSASKSGLNAPVNIETMKDFFNFTGGSLFYCLSAVFVAYGISKVMGPILSVSEALKDALPCILTLQLYEVALLGVLVLIVSRKVVDDAISIVILIALFLVGTSIAFGTAVDKDIPMGFWLGLTGVAIAFAKLSIMRRFAGIPFRVLTILGFGVLIACNYLGPILLARSIEINPTQEPARRELWFAVWLAILMGAVMVLIEAVRGKPRQQEQSDGQAAFLKTPVMVYVFVLILLFASGTHQYSMGFTFALERVLGDFVPIVLVSSLLLIEILRNSGKGFGVIETAVSLIPFATMILAIYNKSVLGTSRIGFGLISYPPVILAVSGLAIAILALCHRWYRLLFVVAIYGLGVIATLGFSPEHPHDLNNIPVCFGILVAGLFVYGIIIRNQYVCVAGTVILCTGLSLWDGFLKFTASYQLSHVGGIGGVCGLASVVLCMVFGREFVKAFRILGILCLAGFIYDYLPEESHWRYVVVLIGMVVLIAALWFRTRDTLIILIPWGPYLIKLYTATSQIAYWRFVIIGFMLLGAGTVVSLFKRPAGR